MHTCALLCLYLRHKYSRVSTRVYSWNPLHCLYFTFPVCLSRAVSVMYFFICMCLPQFLKEPKQFSKLGARPPKGILLEGDPGEAGSGCARTAVGDSAWLAAVHAHCMQARTVPESRLHTMEYMSTINDAMQDASCTTKCDAHTCIIMTHTR